MPDAHRIRTDYDANADRYAEFVRSPANRQPLLTAMIDAFAATVGQGTGSVLDAGCGPGHWTAHLRDRGLAARGVDLSPGQIATARRWHPDLSFEVGDLLDLDAAGVAPGSVGGVLANFSLIHTPPAAVPTALTGFARVLTDGGVLLLGGFVDLDRADGWVEYDHTMCPAYRWAPDALAAAVRAAGFVETARLLMQPPPTGRSAGVYLLATKGQPAASVF